MSEIVIGAAGETAPEDLEAGAPSQEKLEAYQKTNRELVDELARMGKGVNPVQALDVMLQTFINTFLTEEDQLALMINFEYRMGILLAQAVSNAKRQQLMEGVPGANLSLRK